MYSLLLFLWAGYAGLQATAPATAFAQVAQVGTADRPYLVAPDVEAGLSHLRCGRLGALFVLCQLIWSGMAIGCLAFAARLVGESVHTAVPDRFPVQLGNLTETIFATGAADRRPLPCENTGVLRCTVRVPFCLLWQLLAATACAFCCFGSVPLWAGPGCCAW